MAKDKTSLIERIKSNSTIKETAILSDSKFFEDKDMIPTQVPMINVALSAKIDGGLTPGITVFAGESKRFKSLFSLLLAKAYMTKYKDAVLLFYDSEFGTPKSYWGSLEIDPNRVIHTPIKDVEELKFDIMQQLQSLTREVDRVCIVIDSLGNLASKKEVEDSIAGKSVADMSRAKSIKSLFRMITPYMNLLDIPMVVVNHVYKSMGMFPTDIVSGGTGPYLSADNIFIIGRKQIKEDDAITGYDFVIKVEKSRYVKEKSQIPITVSFERGISKWSGLLDVALEAKMVVREKSETKKGKPFIYKRIDQETGEIEDTEFLIDETDTALFWLPIINSEEFANFIKTKYALASGMMISDQQIDEEMADA